MNSDLDHIGFHLVFFPTKLKLKGLWHMLIQRSDDIIFGDSYWRLSYMYIIVLGSVECLRLQQCV